MERNIRLLIEYDGSRYDGWQRLGKGHGVTIQGKLEDVLSKMTGEQVELIGAGRTDAGVHAYEQVANFHTNSNMKCWEMKYYLNRYLPGDIAVNRVDDVNVSTAGTMPKLRNISIVLPLAMFPVFLTESIPGTVSISWM